VPADRHPAPGYAIRSPPATTSPGGALTSAPGRSRHAAAARRPAGDLEPQAPAAEIARLTCRSWLNQAQSAAMTVRRTKLVTEHYDLGALRIYREDLVAIATAISELGTLKITL
jgi:hypothetical protein